MPAIQQRKGTERFGPALPGTGMVIALRQLEGGLVAIRFTGGQDVTATYLLRDNADAWERLWVH